MYWLIKLLILKKKVSAYVYVYFFFFFLLLLLRDVYNAAKIPEKHDIGVSQNSCGQLFPIMMKEEGRDPVSNQGSEM